MKTSHTPGPWEFTDMALVGPKIDDKPIWLRPVILRSEVGVSYANARLIAAAPELLEVAQSILADDMLQYLPDEYITKVRAVIAKATGSDT